MKTVFLKKRDFVQENPNSWTFWEILLFQLHSTGKFITSVISKLSTVFFKKHLFVFEKTQFLKVLSKFTLSVALSSMFATFSNSTKIQDFFEKGFYFSFKKTSHMNVFSFFTNWFAFYRKFALFSDLKTFKIFSRQPIEFFSKKLNFWTFWEFLVFQSQVTANLLF